MTGKRLVPVVGLDPDVVFAEIAGWSGGEWPLAIQEKQMPHSVRHDNSAVVTNHEAIAAGD
jgi:hypothetical protein